MNETGQKRLTTEDLKEMLPGESRTFYQTNAYGIESGRVISSRAGRLLGCTFSVSADYSNNTITVTKTT